MKALYIIIKSLPEIIALVKRLEKRAKKQTEKNRSKQIKRDLKKIEKAFEADDAKALNDIFNS